MNPALRPLVNVDCLSLWIGLSVFILFLRLFIDIDVLCGGINANVRNLFSSPTKIVSKIYESLPCISFLGLLKGISYTLFNPDI